MAGDLHAKSAQDCTPMEEKVVGHIFPHISEANEVDLELNNLPLEVLEDFKHVGKMFEVVQVASKSPVLHEDVLDTFMVMEPRVGQVPLADSTCCKDAIGAPCAATRCL